MTHQQIDQRSLAMGRLIAARVRANPDLLAEAKANLKRWLQTCSAGSRVTLLEWQGLLDGGLESALCPLEHDDEESNRLRQSSPFAGPAFVSSRERADLIQQFAAK